MRTPCSVLGALLWVCSASALAAHQEPVGPVAPKSPNVSGYEKTLETLIGQNADGVLWDRLNDKERREIFEKIQALDPRIQQPVGPVAPRPPQPPPKPGPGTPPTKEDFDEAFKTLHLRLEAVGKENPTWQLPSDAVREMDKLVEQLKKSSVKQKLPDR